MRKLLNTILIFFSLGFVNAGEIEPKKINPERVYIVPGGFLLGLDKEETLKFKKVSDQMSSQWYSRGYNNVARVAHTGIGSADLNVFLNRKTSPALSQLHCYRCGFMKEPLVTEDFCKDSGKIWGYEKDIQEVVDRCN